MYENKQANPLDVMCWAHIGTAHVCVCENRVKELRLLEEYLEDLWRYVYNVSHNEKQLAIVNEHSDRIGSALSFLSRPVKQYSDDPEERLEQEIEDALEFERNHGM